MEQHVRERAEKVMEQGMEKVLGGGGEGGAVGTTQLPSNVDVSQRLESLKPGELGVKQEQLTETGQELAQKLDQLVEDTRRLFLEKNKDEDLQKAAIHASRASQIARRNQLLTSEEGRRALEEAKKGVYSGIDFARLLVTSAEFRDELVEALGLIQQSLRRRPEKVGKQQGEQEEEGEEDEEEEEDEEYQEGEEFKDEQQQQQQQQQRGEGTFTSTTPATTTGTTTPFITSTEKEKGARTITTTPAASEAMSENQLDVLAQRFVRLLKRVNQNAEFRDSFRFLIHRMRGAFEKGSLHTERMEQQLQETQAGHAFLEESRQAKDHVIRLIENWTEASLDPLFTQLNALNQQMQNDQETRGELRSLGEFVEKHLTSSTGTKEGGGGMGDEQTIVQEAKKRFASVRDRLLDNYDVRIRRVLEELSYLRDTFRENKAAEVLQRDVQDLARTLLFDEQGQPTVKVELVKDLEVLFSAFLRKVQFVPVPRVAVTTPDFDFAADDIVLNIRELTPKQIHLETLTKVHDPELEQGKQSARGEGQGQGSGTTTTAGTTTGSTYTTTGTTISTSNEPITMETFVRIHLREIHSDLKHVSWYFNKKTGLLQEHDRGHADIKIYGKGLSVDLDVMPGLPVATEEKPVAHTLEVKRCKAHIHRMSLRLYDARHDFLYTIFHPFIKGKIRRGIEAAVEKYMMEYVQDLDKRATTTATGQYPYTRPIKAAQLPPQATTATTTAKTEPAFVPAEVEEVHPEMPVVGAEEQEEPA